MFGKLNRPCRLGLRSLIVDRKYSLIVELKDDDKDESSKAMGLAIYSNSGPTVLS